jgi:hypothetical protein
MVSGGTARPANQSRARTAGLQQSRDTVDLTVHVPDDLAAQLQTGGDLARRALEGFALEEYKSGHLAKVDLRRLPGLKSRYDLDGFLKSRSIWLDYGIEDFRRDREDLNWAGP